MAIGGGPLYGPWTARARDVRGLGYLASGFTEAAYAARRLQNAVNSQNIVFGLHGLMRCEVGLTLLVGDLVVWLQNLLGGSVLGALAATNHRSCQICGQFS